MLFRFVSQIFYEYEHEWFFQKKDIKENEKLCHNNSTWKGALSYPGPHQTITGTEFQS